MLPMIAANLGGSLEYKNFDQAQFTQVIKDITDKNLSLIPENVCTGG
jgi:ADP-heptose:LPS heptosyltransferase